MDLPQTTQLGGASTASVEQVLLQFSIPDIFTDSHHSPFILLQYVIISAVILRSSFTYSNHPFSYKYVCL